MSVDPRQVRSQLDTRREEIHSRHRQGAEGIITCAALTAAMDDALRTLFAGLPVDQQALLSVLALGGYGRAELFPYSDVDVMVLCDSPAGEPAAQDAAQHFLHLLWDAGLNIGHSVRTVDECLALRGTAIDAWISVVESRHVCGSARLAGALFGHLRAIAENGPDPWVVRGVLTDLQVRVDRYGSSVKLLEPNIKKSAGGLRDVHALVWLYRSSETVLPADDTAPASPALIQTLHRRGILDDDDTENISAAVEFLFRVRHEMHYRRESMHDTLEYALQQPVAEGLGYGRSGELRSVEVFMSDYYRHARTVHRTSRRLLQQFRELIEPMPDGRAAGERLPAPLLLYQGNLSVDPSVRSFEDPVTILHAFAVAAETGLEMDFRLRGAIERGADRIPGPDTAREELAERFRRIIRSDHVARTLYVMNDLGVLGRLIPEFGDLVAFFQHNVYHYYTADEHTLIAVGHAEALATGVGTLHDAFRALPRRDTLIMAILLHDIAKPRGVADHEITGVTMARTVLERLGMDEISPDVEFLVRHHLVMEQTAFRRNIHDPQTIKEFAARFVRPVLLDYLYVLTYADLSALNASVWTEWKSAMLRDLYQQTAEVLRQRLTADQIDRFHVDRRAANVRRLIEEIGSEVPEADTIRHIEGINNDTYLEVFTPGEIVDHIRQAQTIGGVVTRFRHAGGSTEVSVIAQDAPFALSRFCAVLSANDANIFDANIFTRDDGVIIDRFRVSATGSGGPLDARTCDKVSLDLARVMRGDLDVEQLFREHHRKWRRRPRTSRNPTIRTDVVFEDNPRYTILDVYAPDSVGFLYRVTETMSTLGLNIYFAKIATRVDGIIDAFYVLDRAGAPVRDARRRAEIRSTILHTIRSIRELTPE